MSLKPMFILAKAEKKPFSTELCMFCQEKIVVPKKVDKRHKTLNVSSQYFQNVIELLKQYNDILSKHYSDLYNAVIHKNGEDLKNEGFCYHYRCKRDFNRAVHDVKRSKKRQQDSKEIENEAPPSRKLCSSMETFDSNQCLFCQRISEERLHDIIQGSKDLELKTAFRECPSSLEVFKIRLLGAHDAMVSELKYHQKCWNKIIVNRIPEVLYTSTIPSSSELETLRSHISMPSSSAESTHFSSSHGILASSDSVSVLKTDFCIKKLLACFEN